MIDPQQEFNAVLSDQTTTAVGPSDSSAALMADTELPVQQLGQWQLIWRRLRRHHVALVGASVLGFLIILAFIGPLISPETPESFNYLATNKPPQLSWHYLMGTDANGHAVIMYILYGARVSLEVGVFAAFLTAIIGIGVGAVSGYFGGWVDAFWMRVTDVFLTLPGLPLLILLTAFLAGGSVGLIILIFGFLGWPSTSRLIRSYYLSFRQQEFTEAARAVGVADSRIIFRHILPNAISPVIVSFTLNVAGFISGEAAIDFLGVGLHPPSVSWGLALAYSQDYFTSGNWWWAFFPGLALLITVLSVNFVGDGLRDALDVRARAR